MVTTDTYLGKKCKCLQCGYEWVARVDYRPPLCPAHCPRQHYWDIAPDRIISEYKPRKKSRKR